MGGYRYPGSLGQDGRPQEDVRDGTMGAFASTPPGTIGGPGTSPDLTSRLRSASTWLDLQPIVVRLLGPTSFSAGVVYGMGEDLVASVFELAALVKVLVLADLYDGTRSGWASTSNAGPRLDPLRPTLGSFSGGWLEHEAREARAQRDALIDAIRSIFAEPGELLDALKDEYAEKWQRFEVLNAQASLSARFQAGKLFGEVLVALLGVLTVGAALARLGAKLVGKFPKLWSRLERASDTLIRRQPASGDAPPVRADVASAEQRNVASSGPREPSIAGPQDRATKLEPGSPEHKEDRWARYQARGGGKEYASWSKQYDVNMRNFQYGLQREAAYREATGASEGTLKTALTNRQIDLLKANEMYAGQIKTGPVSLTADNALAIRKDAWLVQQGWQVEHILENGASRPYLEALTRGGVSYHIGPRLPLP